MIKRLLISIFLIILLVGGVLVGSSMLFTNRYEANFPEAVAAEPESAEVSLPSVPNTAGNQVQPAEATIAESDSFGAPLPAESAETAETAELPEETEAPAEETAVPAAADDSVIREDVFSGDETPVPQIGAPAPGGDPEAILADMTLKDKICQMLFVTPEALTGFGQVVQSGDSTRDAIANYPVGGVIYFGQNLEDQEQTKEMLAGIQSFSMELTGRGLFLGVDEEGGTVARLADNLDTAEFDDMRVYGEEGDPDKAYEIGETLAKELTALGFNLDFAPVADVLTNEDNTVVADRSFGSDPELVSSMVSAEVRGLQENRVMAVTKHFPGHGSTGGDTHDGFAASDRTEDELKECDLLPFRAAMDEDVAMIMMGHMTMTELDEDNPASLSEIIVTDLLREELGYEGVIITDALNMGAIMELYSYGEATVKAFAAGCDMVLCVDELDEVIDAVTDAVEDGILSEEAIDASVLRILTLKQEYGLLK